MINAIGVLYLEFVIQVFFTQLSLSYCIEQQMLGVSSLCLLSHSDDDLNHANKMFHQCFTKSIKKPCKLFIHKALFFHFVENIGIEPMTSCMPCKRSSQLS